MNNVHKIKELLIDLCIYYFTPPTLEAYYYSSVILRERQLYRSWFETYYENICTLCDQTNPQGLTQKQKKIRDEKRKNMSKKNYRSQLTKRDAPVRDPSLCKGWTFAQDEKRGIYYATLKNQRKDTYTNGQGEQSFFNEESHTVVPPSPPPLEADRLQKLEEELQRLRNALSELNPPPPPIPRIPSNLLNSDGNLTPYFFSPAGDLFPSNPPLLFDEEEYEGEFNSLCDLEEPPMHSSFTMHIDNDNQDSNRVECEGGCSSPSIPNFPPPPIPAFLLSPIKDPSPIKESHTATELIFEEYVPPKTASGPPPPPPPPVNKQTKVEKKDVTKNNSENMENMSSSGLGEITSMKLKSSGVQRSPGGTPLKGTGSPAHDSFLAKALKNKFKLALSRSPSIKDNQMVNSPLKVLQDEPSTDYDEDNSVVSDSEWDSPTCSPLRV